MSNFSKCIATISIVLFLLAGTLIGCGCQDKNYITQVFPEGPGGEGAAGDYAEFGRNYESPFTVVMAASNSASKVQAMLEYQCDGTNDQVQLAAAIAAVRSNGTVGGSISLLDGTYVFDARMITYYTSSNKGQPLKITGQGESTIIDVTSGTLNSANGAWTFIGEYTTTTGTLTQDGNEGQQTISVSGTDAASFAADDYVRISSGEKYGQNTLGEIFKVESISSGSITLDNYLNDTYSTGSHAAIITKMIMVTDLEISNVKFVGDTSNTVACGLMVQAGDNIDIHDVYYNDIWYASLRLWDVINSKVHDNTTKGTNYIGLGYGIAISAASKNNNIYNNVTSNTTKLCTIGGGPGVGVTLFTNVHHNQGYNLQHGIETHGESKYTIVEHNMINGCYGHALSASDDHVTFSNNIVTNHWNNGTSSNGAIEVNGANVTTFTARGNQLHWNSSATNTAQAWGMFIGNTTVNLDTLIIENNIFDGYVNEIQTSLSFDYDRRSGNVGYTTVNTGSATGVGKFQPITHGLGLAPLRTDISISMIHSATPTWTPFVSSGSLATSTKFWVAAPNGEKFIWRVDTED